MLLLVGMLASFVIWLVGLACEATGIDQWLKPGCVKRKLCSTLRTGREAPAKGWPMEPVSQWLERLRTLPENVLRQAAMEA